MIRRPPRSTLSSSSAASDVYKRQVRGMLRVTAMAMAGFTCHALFRNLGKPSQLHSRAITSMVTNSRRCAPRAPPSAAASPLSTQATRGAGVGGAVFGDARNQDILIYMNTDHEPRFVPRSEAMVSVFDSGFILGDGVWEGLRLYNGKFFRMEAHLKRLYEACKFMDIHIGLSPQQLEADLNQLVQLNQMKSGCHARLMVTRGEKWTPYQGPAVNKGPPTIVCIAEHKPCLLYTSPSPRDS
eukprot:TRINITY_DN36812_c0_g1_i1.p1 TRINITY_DN36812_c0_g1~~TRINITY_DN36812_c0_g1_i1.p1  ORF type:complete len:241 (+),score=44.88 TRINITY_DN36812_c0_g1_i1:131-853(+)